MYKDVLCSRKQVPASASTGSDPAARPPPGQRVPCPTGRPRARRRVPVPRSPASAPRQPPTFPCRRPCPTPAFSTAGARAPSARLGSAHPPATGCSPTGTGTGSAATLARAAPLSMAPALTSARRRFRRLPAHTIE